MKKLLYIEASPRKSRSLSTQLAEVFIENFLAKNPEYSLIKLNLWSLELPEFNEAATNAKFKFPHGQAMTEAENEIWSKVMALFRQFKSADKYLLSIPMWNFLFPYKLKHYIDLITQPGLSFEISPEGEYRGLVTGRPVMLIYSRGGDYSEKETSALDFQRNYLRFYFQFIGFTDIREIVAGPTQGDVKIVEAVKQKAISQAISAAGDF
ncbi:MAG: NAD(P)H-dependent oxidoreductase [Victivallaceae bacterium]